jgi:hypothetical protein
VDEGRDDGRIDGAEDWGEVTATEGEDCDAAGGGAELLSQAAVAARASAVNPAHQIPR